MTYTYTICLINGQELYYFDSLKTKELIFEDGNSGMVVCLTRPLIKETQNLLYKADIGTRLTGLTIRKYDGSGALLNQVDYRDILICKYEKGAELIMEFKFQK